MATGASVVKRYELANREERVELLIENYGCFDDILDIELMTIENRIKEEYMYRRFTGTEELGVRVQTSSHGSPTEAKAIVSMEIEAALESHDFTNIIFKDIAGMDEIRRDLYTLELMKMDFLVLKKQVRVLKAPERNAVERFYGDGVDLRTLAEEQVIDYDSVRKRLRQARTHLKNNMFIYWEGTKRRAI